MLDFIPPRETVLVTTRGTISHFAKEEIKENVTPTDWHMPIDPQHFAISVHKGSLTAQLIQESGIFVVNFVGLDFAEKISLIGKHSGQTTDKFALAEIRKEEAEGVDCCRINGAVAYIGCHLVQQIALGEYILFIGNVVVSRELVSGVKRLFHLGGGEFGSIY